MPGIKPRFATKQIEIYRRRKRYHKDIMQEDLRRQYTYLTWHSIECPWFSHVSPCVLNVALRLLQSSAELRRSLCCVFAVSGLDQLSLKFMTGL